MQIQFRVWAPSFSHKLLTQPSHFKSSVVLIKPVRSNPLPDATQTCNEHHMLAELENCVALDSQSHTITKSVVHFWTWLVHVDQMMDFQQPCPIWLMWTACQHVATSFQQPHLLTSPLAPSLQSGSCNSCLSSPHPRLPTILLPLQQICVFLFPRQ